MEQQFQVKKRKENTTLHKIGGTRLLVLKMTGIKGMENISYSNNLN